MELKSEVRGRVETFLLQLASYSLESLAYKYSEGHLVKHVCFLNFNAGAPWLLAIY